MEHGYTPQNLKDLMLKHQLKNPDVAGLLEVTTTNVSSWRVGIDQKHHRDMPVKQWLKLLNHLEPKQAKYLAVAERANIEIVGVFVVSASTEQEAMNKAIEQFQFAEPNPKDSITIYNFDELEQGWDYS